MANPVSDQEANDCVQSLSKDEVRGMVRMTDEMINISESGSVTEEDMETNVRT